MPLLEFTSKGIYCAQADVYLDPWRGVDKAIISHGHSDHARWGSKQYITHEINVPIIKHRLGNISVTALKYGEKFCMNGVQFSLHPAGHVPGSSQIRIEYKGEIWVFTGDYKIQKDGISTPFEIIECHTFITECTFGLPVFSWLKPKIIHDEIIKIKAETDKDIISIIEDVGACLLYTSPSPRDLSTSRMPSSA